ncbi:MAG: c(7)-type cytochrome triheme domain-containing protein [Betaproteobacteria bacterium]
MTRGPRRLIALAASVLFQAAFLAGCTAPGSWKSVLLEPGPPAKRVVQPARHIYKKPEPTPVVAMQAEVAPTDWASVRDLLPKDPNGAPDWVQALGAGMIQPKSSLDGKAEEPPVLDLAVELTPKDMDDFKATFPHKMHTQILGCDNCHDAVFKMEAGADAITMEKIAAGEFCGRCHGTIAFDIDTGCPRCHLSMPR